MDAGAVNKAYTTLLYTCTKCCYCTNNKQEFSTHLCVEKEIDRNQYIDLINKNNILTRQNNNYLDIIRQQNTKILTLESIINNFNNIFSQNIGKTTDQVIYQKDSIVKQDVKQDVKEVVKQDVKEVVKQDVKEVVKQDVKEVVKQDVEQDVEQEDKQDHIEQEIVSDGEHEGSGKKMVFRAIRGMDTRPEYTEEEIQETYDKVNKKEINENKELYMLTKDECDDKILSLMDAIRVQKQYAGELRELRNVRFRLLKFLTLTQYIDFLGKHITQMREIFSSRMDGKKISGIVKTRLLLPLELRFLEMKGYETVSLDTNEISLLKKYLRYKYGFDKKYTVFDKNNIVSLYSCYYIALFNVVDYIKIILPNKYGINNLIYLDVHKSSDDDPFSFYYLEQIGSNQLGNKDSDDNTVIRNWVMDCRLDDIVGYIAGSVMEYSINLYRKIYYSIYHDNDYRNDNSGDHQILEYEGEQLLQNIVIMADYNNFNNLIRQIIKEKCKYIPTKNDKFNLYSDDPINRRRLKKIDTEETKKNIMTNIKRLYDTIDDDQLDALYLTISNR